MIGKSMNTNQRKVLLMSLSFVLVFAFVFGGLSGEVLASTQETNPGESVTYENIPVGDYEATVEVRERDVETEKNVTDNIYIWENSKNHIVSIPKGAETIKNFEAITAHDLSGSIKSTFSVGIIENGDQEKTIASTTLPEGDRSGEQITFEDVDVSNADELFFEISGHGANFGTIVVDYDIDYRGEMPTGSTWY